MIIFGSLVGQSISPRVGPSTTKFFPMLLKSFLEQSEVSFSSICSFIYSFIYKHSDSQFAHDLEQLSLWIDEGKTSNVGSQNCCVQVGRSIQPPPTLLPLSTPPNLDTDKIYLINRMDGQQTDRWTDGPINRHPLF